MPQEHAKAMIAELVDIHASRSETQDEVQSLTDRLRMLKISFFQSTKTLIEAFIAMDGIVKLAELLKVSNWKIQATALDIFPKLVEFPAT